MRNASKLPLPTNELTMAQYDAFPPAVRHFLANAPFNLGLSPYWIADIKASGPDRWIATVTEQLPSIINSSALAAYGPDHPQAQ